jgi:hypothetical protein
MALVTDENKTNALFEKGRHWINDAYWLVMPWKLQDPGVTLSYVKVIPCQMGKQMFYNLL